MYKIDRRGGPWGAQKSFTRTDPLFETPPRVGPGAPSPPSNNFLYRANLLRMINKCITKLIVVGGRPNGVF